MKFKLSLLLTLSVACSDEGSEELDAGSQDASVVADAGVRAQCPLPENNPSCQTATDCGNNGSSPSACEFCQQRSYNQKVCALGNCQSPELVTNTVVYRYDLGDFSTRIKSIAGYVISEETTGGLTISCEDIYQRRLVLTESCYNVLDVRYNDLSRPGEALRLSFNMFASGRRALFIAYGFDSEGAEGSPLAASCRAHDIPPSPAERIDLDGDIMKRIQ